MKKLTGAAIHAPKSFSLAIKNVKATRIFSSRRVIITINNFLVHGGNNITHGNRY